MAGGDQSIEERSGKEASGDGECMDALSGMLSDLQIDLLECAQARELVEVSQGAHRQLTDSEERTCSICTNKYCTDKGYCAGKD